MKLSHLTNIQCTFENKDDLFDDREDAVFDIDRAKRDYTHILVAANSLVTRINFLYNKLLSATMAANLPILDDANYERVPSATKKKYIITIPAPQRRPLIPKGVNVNLAPIHNRPAHMRFYSNMHLQEFPTYMPIVNEIKRAVGNLDGWNVMLKKLSASIKKHNHQ